MAAFLGAVFAHLASPSVIAALLGDSPTGRLATNLDIIDGGQTLPDQSLSDSCLVSKVLLYSVSNPTLIGDFANPRPDRILAPARNHETVAHPMLNVAIPSTDVTGSGSHPGIVDVIGSDSNPRVADFSMNPRILSS